MNKQLQSTNTKPGPSPARLPPQSPDGTQIGSSRLLLLLLCLGLLVCLAVAGIYGWQRQQGDEGRVITEAQRLKQTRQNLHRLAIHIDRYELEQLKKKRDRVCEELKSVDKQLLNVARDRAESLFAFGPTGEIQQVIAESLKKIDTEKIQLSELTSDLARCEEALENGREACMEHVWLVESSGRGGCSLEPIGDHERIALETRVVEELELQRDQLLVVSHPNQAKVKSLNLAIDERKAKIEYLSAKDAGNLGDTPELVVQRYVLDLKRQIGDLRSSLSSELAIYRENYEKAVKSERPKAEAKVKKLQIEKEKLVAELELIDKQLLE